MKCCLFQLFSLALEGSQFWLILIFATCLYTVWSHKVALVTHTFLLIFLKIFFFEREGRRERLLQEPRLLHFAPLYSNIPAVTSTTRRFRAWENVRYRMSAPRLPQKFVKVGRKPNVNVKKIAVLDFLELTFLQGEDQPHMKIYFRRPEELKVRGWI